MAVNFCISSSIRIGRPPGTTRRLDRPSDRPSRQIALQHLVAWSAQPTSPQHRRPGQLTASLSGSAVSQGPTQHYAAAATADIDRHRHRLCISTRRLRRPPPRYRKGWPSTTPLQADLSPEVSASLVALARRSQPGRKGPVKSRIPKTLKCLNHEIWDLTGPFRSGSLVVDRATREVETDPSTDPHPAGTHAFGPGPFPSEPGPPEAYQ